MTVCIYDFGRPLSIACRIFKRLVSRLVSVRVIEEQLELPEESRIFEQRGAGFETLAIREGIERSSYGEHLSLIHI